MWWFFKRKQKSVKSEPTIFRSFATLRESVFAASGGSKAWPPVRLEQHLKVLSTHYPLWIDDDYRFVIVGRVRLPRGYDYREASLLIVLPQDYPVTPPGVGDHKVYVWPPLRFRGRPLKDLHPETTPGFLTPGFGPWAWWCYQRIRWLPNRDDLVRLVEMIRADFINPRIS
jgi:hypothetical protein